MSASALKQPQPAAPFAGWPLQQGGASPYGFVWYTRPAAFVSQATVSHGTRSSSMMTENLMDRVLDKNRAEITAVGGLLVIYDWRTVRTFDTEVIRFYIDRIAARRVPVRGVVVAMDMNALMRAAAHAVNGVISKVYGFELDVCPSPDAALRAHRIQYPDPQFVIA
jgi:hypothetical protein